VNADASFCSVVAVRSRVCWQAAPMRLYATELVAPDGGVYGHRSRPWRPNAGLCRGDCQPISCAPGWGVSPKAYGERQAAPDPRCVGVQIGPRNCFMLATRLRAWRVGWV